MTSLVAHEGIQRDRALAAEVLARLDGMNGASKRLAALAQSSRT